MYIEYILTVNAANNRACLSWSEAVRWSCERE